MKKFENISTLIEMTRSEKIFTTGGLTDLPTTTVKNFYTNVSTSHFTSMTQPSDHNIDHQLDDSATDTKWDD
jgi:hypothetical protein